MPRSLAATSVLFAAFSSLALAASEVGSPNLFECSPAAIQYTCDKPPCQIIARPGDDAASSLENFGEITDQTGTVSWRPVDQKAGTVVVLYITNADGEQATSARLTINAPNDDSNALGSDGKCGGSSSGSSSDSSSSSSGESSSSSGAGASASSAVSSVSSKASDAAASATSKAGSITSDLASKTDSAANAGQTGSDSGSGAAGNFVKSSALVAAVVVVASAVF
ncbi:uncharacterized protein JCM6883_004214 [Sporobolomyces salmoneus]|uniref:uncharacterized protein n=1 Tax=Sporobolomyces salmoneus TaxID=183962 RepID=UPI00316C6458